MIKKEQISRRLKRIEGQVRGIQKMIAEGKYCVDVITQSSAIKEALSSVENLVLENHLNTHVTEQMKSGRVNKAVAEVLKIYKLAKRR